MKKVLVVKYTPRQGSSTEVLLNEVKKSLTNGFELEELDLTMDIPEPMGRQAITSYLDEIGWEAAGPDHQGPGVEYLRMKEFAAQVSKADILVLAFPFYNYFLPGTVKLWLDNVSLEGIAFERTDYGPMGLWKGKKALVVNTSGGTLKDSSRDFSSPYLRHMFKYWGFDEVQIQGLYGINYSGILPERLREFRQEIKRIFSGWA